MKDLNLIDFSDFYFNGYYLSDFGGVVASTDGGSLKYSLLPSRDYVTDRPYNYDGDIVFSSSLTPRVWEIPVYFEDLSNKNIRQISKWLNSDKTSYFYFKGDSIRINARLDSDSYNLLTETGLEGLTTLKFIAHDPYFYDIKPTRYTIDRIADKYYFNQGTLTCPCVFYLTGSGDINISVIGSDGVSQSCTVKNISGGAIVNTYNMICTSQNGDNKFNDFEGDYIQIPPGKFTLVISGALRSVIEFHGRYV